MAWSHLFHCLSQGWCSSSRPSAVPFRASPEAAENDQVAKSHPAFVLAHVPHEAVAGDQIAECPCEATRDEQVGPRAVGLEGDQGSDPGNHPAAMYSQVGNYRLYRSVDVV